MKEIYSLFHYFIVLLFAKLKKKLFSNGEIEQWSNGFTLIELLVVFSVMAVLSMIGIAAFVSYSHEQAVNGAVLGVETMLETARSNALSQITVDSGGSHVCTSSVLTGYEVCLHGDSNCTTSVDYELHPVCNGAVATTTVIDSGDLPNSPDISFASGSTTSFVFNVINGGVNPGAIIITSDYGISKTITVSSNGSISVQ